MPQPLHILIVDDEQSICWGLRRLVEGLGHRATIASSAEQGIGSARDEPPDLIMLDVRLPGMDGLAAIEHFRGAAPLAPIVVMTAYGDLATAVSAVRNGAFEYLVKPFDLEVARRVIDRAAQWQGQAGDAPVPKAPEPHAAGLVGHSTAMHEVFKRIALVAPSDACVHISGDSGTGKELVARAIHQFSRRSGGPFVAVNVAALNPSVVESELFGHVRGAFTGAEQSHRGLLEQSSGGTIFLDEVADIPPALQVKLLRAVEHGEILPVGSGKPTAIDLRVISATHQNLLDRVRDGSFRHDLLFRLSTFEIAIPPLRDRRDDIQPLAEHFLAVLAEKSHAPAVALSVEALAELERRPWYGNVRELKNAVEHALIVARGGTIGVEHLPRPIAAPTGHGGNEQAIAASIRKWVEARLENGAEMNDLY
ncbi:MAG TPA: sigma-54 dependent transcriptional regulator, partial [Pirellulales bacterium]|nr:sigma-54 dependent transcriptional regulator [Pirellulales bacterium]